MNAQVLVIGHTGFIGRSIVEYLNLKRIKFQGIATKECDLKEPQSVNYLSELFKKNTTVIITVAINRELGDTIENMQTHINMLANVARVLESHPVKKCVYLSTSDVYGTSDKLPITEQTPVNPKTYYAIAKYCCEEFLKITAQKVKVPLLILRYGGVFGPGQKNIGYGLNFFIKGILEEEKVKLWGNGKELRDTVYVKDLAKIIVELSLQKITGVYNIATGKSRSFVDMIKILKKISPKKFKTEGRKRTRPAFDQVFNISELKKSLPNVYFTPTREALKQTLKFNQELGDTKS